MAAVSNEDVGPEIAQVPPSEIVFLVGSGLSAAQPSGLPTGANLRTRLLRDLMSRAGTVLTTAEVDQLGRAIAVEQCFIPDGAGGQAIVNGIPLEGVLDICRQLFTDGEQRVLQFLKDNLLTATPNPGHEFLAAGLVSSSPVFPRVVTLNYDTLIEDARPGAHWRRVRVATSGDYDCWSPSRSLLLKLHGSFDVPGSIVATLSTEHGLDPWKRDLLRRIVTDKVLVMIGYSGYDFDVCPILVESRPRLVYWNTFCANETCSKEGLDLLSLGGRHIFGDVVKLLLCIRENMPAELRALLPPISPRTGCSREAQSMLLDEKDALTWLVRLSIEAGLGEIALKLVDGINKRWSPAKEEFGLWRDKARAYFLVDHNPQELRECKSSYRRALRCARSRLEAADIWINYHEPCRLELKYAPGIVTKLRAGGGMIAALILGWLNTLWLKRSEISRLRGYLWLRLAQDLENLVRQSPLARYSWPRLVGSSSTEWLLSQARRCFRRDDNYLGTLQTERIRLRVSSSPLEEQLRAAFSMRDYYRRLGYLTAWSNSNRDVIEVMRKSGNANSDDDIAKARILAQEALEVSTLAGDRPGITKAKDLLALFC